MGTFVGFLSIFFPSSLLELLVELSLFRRFILRCLSRFLISASADSPCFRTNSPNNVVRSRKVIWSSLLSLLVDRRLRDFPLFLLCGVRDLPRLVLFSFLLFLSSLSRRLNRSLPFWLLSRSRRERERDLRLEPRSRSKGGDDEGVRSRFFLLYDL